MGYYSIKTNSAGETRRLGAILGGFLLPGDCIPLLGEMGSGKTCFVQGVAEGLGVSNDTIICSPSFTLINQYSGRIPLYHIDLFRLNSCRDLEDLEIIDLIHGDGVTMIEWPQIVLPGLPEIILRIEFNWDMTSETTRIISFISDTDRFDALVGALHD
ncbi:tRNA (adenosine(37)-N6)-threonylcarbamoyltransferase complex ATPase subunit type 1 TsaE [bacterium]|nr:tRNA (adenosine(37)-N6)-threonylcarbamoyltransferase complex ATPase subunit type 1 TsaE [candidate division CSSED10-310 bacterium]